MPEMNYQTRQISVQLEVELTRHGDALKDIFMSLFIAGYKQGIADALAEIDKQLVNLAADKL